MTYQRFEDLPVWKLAMAFADRCFDLVEDRAFVGQGDVRDQIQRASFSISSNVAEGFERGTTNELLAYIYIARGSAGESRSALRFVRRRQKFSHLHMQADELIEVVERISRQLRGWAESLQNSDIRGQRHLNDGVRAQADRARRAAEFMDKLKRVQRGEQYEDVFGPLPSSQNGDDEHVAMDGGCR